MDLLITFDYGMVSIEDMSEKARLGLRRHNDVRSLFYFYSGEYDLTEDENYFYIKGQRKGMFCISEHKLIPRDIIDAHGIPTKRLKKAIRNPIDMFRNKASCYTSDDRMVIPLCDVYKHVTLTIPKGITVRIIQDEWFLVGNE